MVEAEAQGEVGQIELALERMKQLEIRNNAQFLCKLRYPADLMVQVNGLLVGAFKNAGFDLFS